MPIISLPYGKSKISGRIANEDMTILLPQITPRAKEEEIIKASLANPLASLPLHQLAENRKKAVIIISDSSRPVPSFRFLPYVVKELEQGGLKASQITIIVARGTHRALTAEEIKELVGEETFSRVDCLSSCPEEKDHAYLGQTSLGTPIKVFLPILEADLKIVTGNLDFHHLMGFSGGFKGLFIAAASKDSISANHGLSLRFSTHSGELKSNPVRKDMEEFIQKVGVDFIFNVILDYQHRIIEAFAGDPYQAHERGCQRLSSLLQVEVEKPADIIITSPGGFPKDVNLYQTVKTLQNALTLIKPGGVIVLAAQCPEDYGNPILAHWVEKLGTGKAVLEKLDNNFVLGGHKLKYITGVINKAQVKMITDLPASILNKLQIEKQPNLQEAIDSTLVQFPHKNPRIILMPYGGFILPKLKK